jgi:hypothetical protein
MVNIFETQLIQLPTSPNGSSLPLAHSTDWARFVAITQAGYFSSPTPCPVYGEILLYTFYGRAAYRFKEDGVAYSTPSYSPVCFILKPTLTALARRILPFDSGGFDKYGPGLDLSIENATRIGPRHAQVIGKMNIELVHSVDGDSEVVEDEVRAEFTAKVTPQGVHLEQASLL